MEVLDRITIALKEAGKTQKELCQHLGLSKNAYTDWKSGHMQSYKKHLPEIADFLNVSVDYLTGRTDEKALPTAEELSQDHKMLIDLFDSLSEEQKESLLTLMRSLKEKQGDE